VSPLNETGGFREPELRGRRNRGGGSKIFSHARKINGDEGRKRKKVERELAIEEGGSLLSRVNGMMGAGPPASSQTQ